jgi:hypothetical protein
MGVVSQHALTNNNDIYSVMKVPAGYVIKPVVYEIENIVCDRMLSMLTQVSWTCQFSVLPGDNILPKITYYSFSCENNLLINPEECYFSLDIITMVKV